MKGIDISYYQRHMTDFNAAHAGGVEFVIAKINESSLADASCLTHIANAKAAGLHVGGYTFCRATSVSGAKAEAKNAVKYLQGQQLDMPIFYDIECPAQYECGANTLIQMCHAFEDVVKAAGYRFGVYSSANGYYYLVPPTRFRQEFPDAVMWVAQYGVDQCRIADADIWQYSDSGKVNGFNDKVDMNICYHADFVFRDTPIQSTKPTQPEPVAVPSTSVILPTIKRGNKGVAVAMMQMALKCHGFWNGALSNWTDGDFGSGTESKLKQFQTKHGITADGICGNQTWYILLNK